MSRLSLPRRRTNFSGLALCLARMGKHPFDPRRNIATVPPVTIPYLRERTGGGDSLRVTTDNQPKGRKEKKMGLLLDLLERCEKLDIRGWYRAKEELATLREAGEKMAALLGEDITDDQLTEALEAWEAANK